MAQLFFHKPTSELEWEMLTDNEHNQIPNNTRQSSDIQTDTIPQADRQLPTTNTDNKTTIVMPTQRHADTPTYFVVSDKTYRVVRFAGRTMLVVIVGGGIVIGACWILTEVLAAVAVLAAQAIAAIKLILELLAWVAGAAFVVFLFMFGVSLGNTEGGGTSTHNPLSTTSNNGAQNIQININNNGNQKNN